jgi:hypothetical protein
MVLTSALPVAAERIASAQQQAREAQAQQAREAEREQNRAASEARRQEQEAMRRQQDAARVSREQSVRAQEEEARRQQEAARTQQNEARRAQEEAAHAQQNAVHEQQNAVREERNALREQQRQQEEIARQGQLAKQAAMEREARERAAANEREAREHAATAAATAAEARANRIEEHEHHVTSTAGGAPTFQWRPRPTTVPPLQMTMAPFEKAIPQPVLQENINAAEREHAQAVIANLRAHLYPIDAQFAPANYAALRQEALNNYLNNYAAMVNNQTYWFNRQNTFVNPYPSYEWPAWWNTQTNPGWQFSNGFTLGSLATIGLDWLRWGWHPYYGPPPEGFACATDYVPTQWIYVPAYGLWRQAGVMGWAQSGPPFDYTGPITVEILEARHINTRDPYTGFEHKSVINVPYFYNAFYYPDQERWAYINRHNFFVWVNA